MTPTAPNPNAPITHRDLTRLAWCAIAVVVVAVLAFASELVPTLRVVVSPGPRTAGEAEQDQERRVGQFNERQTRYLAQAQGRSMFVVPPPPNELAAGEKPAEEETPDAEGPAPKPSRYAGPDPIAVINNAVWFSDSTVVAVGKERSGVRVVSVDDAPWSVRLRWREVEFDVPIFENTTQSFLTKPESRGRP